MFNKKCAEMTVSASDFCQTKFEFIKKDQQIERFCVRQMSDQKEKVISRQI